MEKRQGPPFERTIFICCNEREPGEEACANRGARTLQETLKKYVKDNGLRDRIRVMKSSCMDRCAEGPNLCIQPENRWYTHVQKEDLPQLIREWISIPERK